MEQLLGQLCFVDARKRWPSLTKPEFEEAARAVLAKHPKAPKSNELVAALQLELSARYPFTQVTRA